MQFDQKTILEGVGLFASVLTIVSLLMTEFVRFRLLGFLSNAVWFGFGIMISSVSVAGTNAILMVVNLVFLVRHLRAKEYFNIVEVRRNAVFLGEFLKHFKKEILEFYPNFVYDPAREVYPFFALRNVTAAALFVLELKHDNRLFLILDFSIPGYRDMKVGRFVYRRGSEVWQKLVALKHESVYSEIPGSLRQLKYLLGRGFKYTEAGDFLVLRL